MNALNFIPRQKTTKLKESDIQKSILTWLRSQKDLVCWKASDMYTRGVSDIVICFNGLFVVIEVKKPGEIPTALQHDFIQRINAVHGIGFYCDSLEKVKESIEFIRRRYNLLTYTLQKTRETIEITDKDVLIIEKFTNSTRH